MRAMVAMTSDNVVPFDDVASTFSELLHAARIRKGESMNAAAKAVGVSHSTWRNWEGGEDSPSAKNMRALAAYTERSVEELLAVVNEDQEREIHTTAASIERQAQRIAALEAEVADLRGQLADYRRQIAALTTNVLEMNTHINMLTQRRSR